MSCEVTNIDVIALGTRIAIYIYAGCSALLGFLTLVGTGPRREIENEEDQAIYVNKVVQHVKDVDQSVMTSTLTGIALMVAAVLHQHILHTFTQYHAYVVLVLLWVITLTGMWFVIHAWEEQASDGNFLVLAPHPHSISVVHPPIQPYGWLRNLPSCTPQIFQNKPLALTVYIVAAIPVVNACMLFILTSTFVWILSVLVAICSRKGWRGQVNPRMFCLFWLVEYVCVISALVIMIEMQLKNNSPEGSTGWPFGNTLALALTFIPLKLVVVRVWRLTIGEEDTIPEPVLGNRVFRVGMSARSASELESLNRKARWDI